MTASTATRTPDASAGTRYLENLFLHVRGRSRRLGARYEELQRIAGQTGPRHHAVQLAASDASALFSEITTYENAVSDLLALIAPFAIEQANRVATIAPGYDDDLAGPLGPIQVDGLVQPLFDAAGIADDFVPWREAFPNYEEDLAQAKT